MKSKVLPFEFEGWDPAGDYGDLFFYNVQITEDYAGYKKGDRFHSVLLSMTEGKVIFYLNNEDLTDSYTVEVELKPKV